LALGTITGKYPAHYFASHQHSFFRKLGYELDGPYMSKILKEKEKE
jgi:hypothetical protein